MNIKEKLIELREENKLKIYEISKILEVEKDTYGKYERENVNIPIKHLIKVCDYFNVSIDYVFSFSKCKKYAHSVTGIDIINAGKRLKEFRKENHLTQEQLAKILNTNRSVLANYERGRTIIASPFLYTICRDYHISADYLLGKTEEPKYLN